MKIARFVILGVFVVGIVAFPFLAKWDNVSRNPIRDPTFKKILQRALGKSGEWSEIFAGQGAGPDNFFGGMGSHPTFCLVWARRNGLIIGTSLVQDDKWQLRQAWILPAKSFDQNDEEIHFFDSTEQIGITYDGSRIVKVWRSAHPDPASRRPLDSHEQPVAMRLGEEFGVAVREALYSDN